ncbi:hypothetical protein [Polaromonas sp. AER18D-145]|nr:hypothetical protein [Polaromonas sp. AER18D-145]
MVTHAHFDHFADAPALANNARCTGPPAGTGRCPR